MIHVKDCGLRILAQIRNHIKRRQRGRTFSFGATSRLMRDERGIAAVEFSLLVPLMLMLYLGLVEISRSVRASQKMDQIVHTLAEITGRKLTGGVNPGQAGIAPAEFPSIFAAGYALMAPLSQTNLRLTVSEVKITPKAGGGYSARVQWTHSNNAATDRPCGVDLTPSTEFGKNNIDPTYVTGTNPPTYIIVADATYPYSPGLNFELFKWRAAPTWTFQRTAYAPVRNGYDPPHIQYRSDAAGSRNCNAPSY